MEKSLQERIFEWICRNDGFELREIERQCQQHLKDVTQVMLFKFYKIFYVLFLIYVVFVLPLAFSSK